MSETLLGVLRHQRISRGLTQREVAVALGTTQSAIARLEAHAVDPRLSTVCAFGDTVGCPVTAAPPDPLEGAVATIRERTTAGDVDGALRGLVQLAADLTQTSLAPQVLRREPPPTGSRRWDAAVAAVVERAARRRGEPVPGWTAAPSRFLDGPWFPVEDVIGRPAPGLACLALASSPAEFAARGIHLDPATFEDV